MDNCQEIWQRASACLKELVDAVDYDRWLANIVPLRQEGRTLYLGLPNTLWVTWVSDNFSDDIVKAIQKSTGLKLQVYFETCEAPAAKPQLAEEKAPEPAEEKPTKITVDYKPLPESTFGFDRRFTFDTFVVGDNNKFAYSACMGVAKNPGGHLNPLFIHSGTGLGKTHLLQAIAQEALALHPKYKILYVSSEDFLNQYLDAMVNKKFTEFRNRYRNLDMLLIDDVQFIGNKEHFQEEVFHTFNALNNAHKQIVMTSDRPPHEINGLEKRLVSRFENGLTAEIMPPDLETRIAIIHKKQETQEYKLSEDVIRYVAARLKSNVRRLEGGIFTLVSWGAVYGQDISIEQTEKLLRDAFVEEKDSLLTIEDVQRIVAEFYDIRMADMTSKRRPAGIALARQVAMYFSRKYLEESFPAIAEKFCRDHSTVIHAVTAVESKLSKSDDFKREMNQIENKLKS